MSMKMWNHPTTGEARIYINSDSLGRGTKVWLVEDKENGHGFFEICHRETESLHCAYHVSGNCGDMPWDIVARREIEDAGLNLDSCKWSEICEVAK